MKVAADSASVPQSRAEPDSGGNGMWSAGADVDADAMGAYEEWVEKIQNMSRETSL
jgi:hypothetical protein